MCPGATTARIIPTISRMCASGFPYELPNEPSIWLRALEPSPRTTRPLLIRSRSIALQAVSSGLRTKASAMPVPSLIRRVAGATAARVENGAPNICGAHTPATPAAS